MKGKFISNFVILKFSSIAIEPKVDGKRALRFIQPVECWSFRTQIYLSFTVPDLIDNFKIYSAYYLAGSFRAQNVNVYSAYTLVNKYM